MSDAQLGVTAAGRRRLATFLSVLSEEMEQEHESEAALLLKLKTALETLLAEDDWLDQEFAEPHPEHGQQYLLYCDPRRRFSVVSVVWGPSHDTPVHDHKTWGVVGVLRGAEVEETFEMRGGKPILIDERRLEPGDVVSLSPSSGDVHRVRNAFYDRTSISIHVYGADIGSVERSMFPADSGPRSFTSGYANRFLPNVWG